MTTPRLYKRVSPSGKQGKTAKIIPDPKQPPIDCTLIDYSPGGACLEVAGRPTLPDRFELLYGTVRKKCRLVWSRGLRVGVVF